MLCRNRYYALTHKGKNASHWKGGKIKKKCLQCGKEFEVWAYRVKKEFCCSWECRNKYYTGGKSPNWKGGITKHNKAIMNTRKYKDWRKIVLNRDIYMCKICTNNGTNKNPLDIHHIYPKYKYPKMVFDVNNGITLCHDCHVKFRGIEEEFIEFFLMLQNEGELIG